MLNIILKLPRTEKFNIGNEYVIRNYYIQKFNNSRENIKKKRLVDRLK